MSDYKICKTYIQYFNDNLTVGFRNYLRLNMVKLQSWYDRIHDGKLGLLISCQEYVNKINIHIKGKLNE